MIAELVSPLEDIVDNVNANAFASIIIKTFSLIGTLYTLWRIWTFTVLPMLRPHEPLELPYLIPGEYCRDVGLDGQSRRLHRHLADPI